MRPVRVLIVEDDPGWVRQLQLACVERDFLPEGIKTVGSRDAALFELEEWDPDLVILDLGIPSTSSSADADEAHGHSVFMEIERICARSSRRIAVAIVSGHVRQSYVDLYGHFRICVDVVDKNKFGKELPGLMKEILKRVRPVLRDLRTHAPNLLPLYERILDDEKSPDDVVRTANQIASVMLVNLGRNIMGDGYPLDVFDMKLIYERLELLRGPDCKIERFWTNDGQRWSPPVAKNWIGGLPYQHFHTIRNYLNFVDHTAAKLAPADTFRHGSIVLDSLNSQKKG